MTTSPTGPIPSATTSQERPPLRLELRRDAVTDLDGAWWPRSRDLPTEAADLVDHFPQSAGRINRLLFSRPDWDADEGKRSPRRIRAQRGKVKVGSFPQDDTHLMVLTMETGLRLRLAVVPSDTDQAEGERRMHAAAEPR